MKKPSLIIGKKQIILTCMTLMLGIAVYVNYALTDSSSVKKNVKSVNGEMLSVSSSQSSESKPDASGTAMSDQTEQEKKSDKENEKDDAKTEADAENYGESRFVNSENTEDFFAQARLEKMTGRDEAVQTLQAIMGGGDVTNDEMVTNALKAVEVSKLIESEGNIEALVKAQGIEDCVVYLDGESAKVVVKTAGLDKAKAAAIKDIILGEVKIPAENIRIFEIK